MKYDVIYHAPYLHGPSAIKWIVDTWEAGFSKRGFNFHRSEGFSQLKRLAQSISPQIVIFDIVNSQIENKAFIDIIKHFKKNGSKIVFNVYWPLWDQPKERAEALLSASYIDLLMGEKELDSMTEFIKIAPVRYIVMPHSCNSNYYYKRAYNELYDFDIVFVGGKLPAKKWFNNEIIKPLRDKYKVGVFGPGWTIKDNILRAGSKFARKLRLPIIAKLFDRCRLNLTENEEAQIYSSSKIMLNFHERDTNLVQSHHILNNRTHKISACGGFQIIDPVACLRAYYPDNCIVTARLEANDWLNKIEFYLSNDYLRNNFAENAMRHCQENNLAEHRVDLLISEIYKT